MQCGYAVSLACMIHAYMDRVSKSAKRIQADASTLPSPEHRMGNGEEARMQRAKTRETWLV